MPLESCMILLDRSPYMRNGDYAPTRLAAQRDAAHLLAGAATGAHPESTVGVAAGTDLLVSPTEDVGRVLGALHRPPPPPAATAGGGASDATDDLAAALQVAALALKHRRNKNGAQRIVLFVGTPLEHVETRALQRVGRQLKKNNVALDVVAIGELEANEAKLRELVEAANGRAGEADRTCHLVTVPPGVILSDALVGSPVLAGGGGGYGGGATATGGFGGGAGGSGGGDDFTEYGGVDPNMDPELAMALRISMEEERARQEAAAAREAAAAAAGSGAGDAEMADATAAPTGAPEDAAAALGLSEEDALLQQALAMSMNENEPAVEAKPSADMSVEEDDDGEDEDAAMQMALQMSMQPGGAAEPPAAAGAQIQDPAFVNELLGTSGVDPNDPEIQEALRQALAKKEAEKKGDSQK